MTHEFLIAKARHWLKKFGCLVVASEVKMGTDCPAAGGGVSISWYSFGTENRAALEVAVMGERLEIPDEETDV